MTRLLIALCCAALLAAAACSGTTAPTSPSETGATITDTATAAGNGSGKGNGDKGKEDKGKEDKGKEDKDKEDKGNGDKGNGDQGSEDKGGGESGGGGISGGNGGATVDDRLTSSPVEIKKFTNGQHADRAPGPSIPIGNPVVWTYLITNQGPVTFTSLSVTDDRGVDVSCPRILPAPGASVTCTGSGRAVEGQYRNVGTVTVIADGKQYTARDTSHYFGVPTVVVSIEKFTNGQRADQAPGPTIPIGSPVTWTYVVTNRSALTFTSLSVTDDRGVAVACPRTLPGPAESLTCTGSGTAVAGQYRNIGTVTVTANGNQYTASDASHYFGGRVNGVSIEKFTNGEDVSRAPGPRIPVGSPVTWTYVITNRSALTFTSLSVTDDRGVSVACPRILPAPGETVTCTGSGTAMAGQYRNVGTVVATANGATYTDSDESFYFGRDDDEGDSRKVALCHRTGNGSFHMIEVSVNAEPAHRGHGDGMVGEDVPGSPGRVFTESCSVR